MVNDFVTVTYSDIKVFSRGDGVETRLMIGGKSAPDTPFTTGTTVFPVGSAAPMHSHNCAEQVTILDGEAEAIIGTEQRTLGKYDTSYIPANVPHRFVNIGGGLLTILWIYGAREVTRTFTETGETVPHLSAGDQV